MFSGKTLDMDDINISADRLIQEKGNLCIFQVYFILKVMTENKFKRRGEFSQIKMFNQNLVKNQDMLHTWTLNLVCEL